jgi:hypothetical protein
MYAEVDGDEKLVPDESDYVSWDISWKSFMSFDETYTVDVRAREISGSWSGYKSAGVVDGDTLHVTIRDDDDFSVYILDSSGGSCPYIYSFDGEQYVFDAEPYGGAVCEGLKRTEWCTLEHLKEVNGNYRISVCNELDETQYIDELNLIVVDHPDGTTVAPGVFGKIYTLSDLKNPVHAYDQYGNNILRLVSENDRQVWQTGGEQRETSSEHKLRDELVFEFEKPMNAERAKLLVNACTSILGSWAAAQYLDLYGRSISRWYEAVDKHGPAYDRVIDWYFKEELYILRAFVETENGWQHKAFIIGGGPYISENKVYPLDISDVHGNILRIKLIPPAHFWKIYHLAVDYSEELQIKVTELEPVDAVDHNGENVTKAVTATDSTYLVMQTRGEWAELDYRAPPQDAEMKRSVLLKASGFYKVHLSEKGRPRWFLIGRLNYDLGFSHRYALEMNQKTKLENWRGISAAFTRIGKSKRTDSDD